MQSTSAAKTFLTLFFMAGLLFSRRRGSLRDREGARPVRFQKFCQLLRGEVEITANIAVILVLQPGLFLFEKLQLFLQVCLGFNLLPPIFNWLRYAQMRKNVRSSRMY